MAVTVSANLTTLWDCESTTNAVGNKPALETEIIKEGSNSVDFTMSSVGSNNIIGFDGTIGDMSNEHIRLWYTSIVFPNVDSKANGGIRFYAKDGTNTAYWYIAGKDTYTGGWINILIDIESTPDSGSVDTSSVTEMGVYHTFLSSPKNQINGWLDYMRYGDGLIAYGTSWSISDVYSDDVSNGYGIVDFFDPVYFINGSLTIGRTSEQTTYSESGTQINFPNAVASSTLFKIKLIGDTSVSSTFSITGCIFATGSEAYELDMDDTNISSLTFTGNTAQGAGKCYFLADDTKATVTGNTFDGCDTIYPKGSKFENNTITNTTSSNGAVYMTDSTTISKCKNLTFSNFSGKYAIYIPASVTGTITLDNFQSDGSGTDIYWAGTSGTLTVNKSNGTNFSTSSTAGGTVSIVSSVTINVHVEDESGTDVGSAYVYIDDDLGVAGNIANTTTDSNGDVSTSYSGSSTDAVIRVRKYGYKPFKTTISLSSDSSTNVTLISDPQQT